MYNKTGKTIIRFGFCDIRNNQGFGKCYQPRPSARLIDDTFLDLDYSGYITKPNRIIVYYFLVILGEPSCHSGSRAVSVNDFY